MMSVPVAGYIVVDIDLNHLIMYDGYRYQYDYNTKSPCMIHNDKSGLALGNDHI